MTQPEHLQPSRSSCQTCAFASTVISLCARQLTNSTETCAWMLNRRMHIWGTCALTLAIDHGLLRQLNTTQAKHLFSRDWAVTVAIQQTGSEEPTTGHDNAASNCITWGSRVAKSTRTAVPVLLNSGSAMMRTFCPSGPVRSSRRQSEAIVQLNTRLQSSSTHW